MVGVRDGDDAKAVVANFHVGGIFIGSWTDLNMLGPNLVKDLSSAALRCRWRSASTRKAAGWPGCPS